MNSSSPRSNNRYLGHPNSQCTPILQNYWPIAPLHITNLMTGPSALDLSSWTLNLPSHTTIVSCSLKPNATRSKWFSSHRATPSI
jgi:hypothetical protein